MQVRFFFPRDTGLDPLSVEGEAPRKGDVVYVSCYDLSTSNPKRDYSKYSKDRRWVVDMVHYSVKTWNRGEVYPDEASGDDYAVEVHLKPDE
jgi:hypothetical protein